jgi:hypothetical protein
MLDIVFVTYRKQSDMRGVLAHVADHSPDCRLIFTGLDAAAGVNRNYGLRQVQSEIVIMMDDDIGGLYSGWAHDLAAPLLSDPAILLASARLMDSNGRPGPCVGAYGLPQVGVVEAQKCEYRGWRRLPTACIAFRRCAAVIQFDENFIGSGYEDLDWMNNLNASFPQSKIVVNNNCRVIHFNEEKRQGGPYFEYNKAHYLSKWPDDITVLRQDDWTRTKGLD